MDPVILMVGRAGEGVNDIEVMPDVPAADLADAISQAFGWPGTYDIQVADKIIPANQTLADAGIWDGSQLTLVTSNRPSRPISGINRPLQVASQTGQGMEGPVAGKRSLQVPLASKNESGASSTINWKPAIPDSSASAASPSPVTGWRQPTAPPESSSTDKTQQP